MKASKAGRWVGSNALRVAFVVALTVLFTVTAFAQTGISSDQQESTPESSAQMEGALGIHFVEDSTSTLLVQRNGKTYLVDVARHTIRELSTVAGRQQPVLRDVSYSTSQPQSNSLVEEQTSASKPPQKKRNHPYRPGDDTLFNLPTGRRIDRHGMVVDFNHRFPYEAAFTGTSRGATLLGLDDFSISSFGFRYGVTKNLSASVYRSPSIAGRVIELGAAYSLLSEQDNKPFNAALRFSVDGQNDFQRNFTTNFELLLSRSITRRAQIYLAPTGSLHNRPLISESSIVNAPPYRPCSAPLAAGSNPALNIRPCADTFALGAGISVDVRPTVALVAEVIPTLANGDDLGIHRPPFGFGIQKKIFRHAFTFGFSTGPGTTTSQRISTRASFLGRAGTDVPSGMFVGFNLNRQLH